MTLTARLRPTLQRRLATIFQLLKTITTPIQARWQVSVAWLREHASMPWSVFQFACLLGIYVLYRKWQTMPVGVAIGAAGLVAAFMTVRDRHWKAAEKFFWIVIIGCLWAMDSNNIVREQKLHDAEQKTISTSLRDTQAKLDETQKQLTGGDSYCYIDFTRYVDGPHLVHRGKYTLHAVTVTIKNMEGSVELFNRIPQAQFHPERDRLKEYHDLVETTISMGDLGPGSDIPMPPLPILKTDREKSLDIIFTGSSTYVLQHTCLSRATNSQPPRYLMAQATRIWTREKVMEPVIDSNFPKDKNGEIACFSAKRSANGSP